MFVPVLTWLLSPKVMCIDDIMALIELREGRVKREGVTIMEELLNELDPVRESVKVEDKGISLER